MSDLQLRLQEPETTVQVAAVGLTDEERLVVRLRELDAEKKRITAEEDDIKAQIREGLKDGLVYGSESVGGTYEFQSRETVRFDWKKAAMNGLFKLPDAEPFISTTVSDALVFKAIERKK